MSTEDQVRKVFRGLENGNGAPFFDHVSDNVDWGVEGTHRLAGHYHYKADFIAGTFGKLAQVLANGTQLHVKHIVKDDQAAVELQSEANAKNGLRFDNHYCWIVYFRDSVIVRVRAYLALVARLFDENPLPA
jgi:ketosteroid isomerase-like protein